MTNNTDTQFFLEVNEEKPVNPPPELISAYVEGNRILPSSTPFPGYWENWRTQYGVEVMDCMSPWSPTRYVDVMAAAQVIKSAAVENCLGYYMGPCPAPILYVSGTDDLLQKWGPKRLEPLIDSLDIRKNFRAPVEKEKSRSTGDKTKQKLFTGGFLEMGSAQSPASLRADSVRILILEECDSAPMDLSSGEGRWDRVAEARTKTFGARKKIMAVSTPTVQGMSLIHERYLMGDQCAYAVPCPFCGKFQILERGTEKGNHGLRADYKAGKLDLVYYLCEHCHDAMFEHHKNKIIPLGKWQARTTPELYRRSFHISSLYSPVGMFSWEDYWLEYQKAQLLPDGMRSFTNLMDGLPYHEKGSRPKLDNVIELRGTYKSREVPDGVLFLTVGIDVQRGSEKDENNPARLEMEVLGHGVGFRTYSIEYKVFEGPINDPFSGAWEKLNLFGGEHFTYRKRDGREFTPKVVFVDSGDGMFSDIVYRFCQRWGNTYPIKGFSNLIKRKKEKGDEVTQGNKMRYRAARMPDGTTIYEINTNYYKTQIYNNLKISRVEGDLQKAGFCEFPRDYGEKYFRMLTAEEKKLDGSFHAGGRRNESLDIRVYALCAGEAYLGKLIMDYRAVVKSKGGNMADVEKVDHRYVLEVLKRQAGVR